MKKEIFIEAICGTLILLFVYTALSKWLALDIFKGALETAPFLRSYATALVVAIPAAEITVSLMLFLPRLRLPGLYASLGLLILFTLYLSSMLLFSPHLPCSCGGVISTLSWSGHLLFNIFFIAMNGIGIWIYTSSAQPNLLYNQAKPKTCINE